MSAEEISEATPFYTIRNSMSKTYVNHLKNFFTKAVRKLIDGMKIRHLREDVGLTEKELGDRVGVTMNMISQVERGLKKPSAETLKRIADVLGVTVDELYRETA